VVVSLKIPLHVLRNPGAVIRTLTYEWYNKIIYIIGLFAPVIFLVLQSPQYLIPTLSWFAISLLSNYPPYYRIGFQYSAYVIPFIYASMIAGFDRVSRISNGSRHWPRARGYITVDAYTNRTVLGSTTFTETTLKKDERTEVKLGFSLPEVVYDLELRGFLVTQNTTIRLDRITLAQKP
jgi:hypothetical protein